MCEFVVACSPGFVTRAESRKTPLVGGICEAVQCIFVDREKSQPPAGAQEGGFQSTADRIAERARNKWNHPEVKDTGPLVIFAEVCTTSTPRPAPVGVDVSSIFVLRGMSGRKLVMCSTCPMNLTPI